MPDHHLRRTPITHVAALVRALVLAMAMVLLLTSCAGGDDTPADPGTSSKDDGGSSEEPAEEEPAPDPGYQAPQAGQCFRMTARQSRASVAASRAVNCAARHTTVVAFVGYLPRPVTAQTPVAQRRRIGDRLCAPAYRRLVGGTLADRASSILTWTLFTPSQGQLERGARWVRCDVLARSGNRLVPLPATRPMFKIGIPPELRVCQTDTGADVSCARPHAFRIAAVFRAVGEAYPDPLTYTPTARDRCQELMGAYGGFWQPPSRAGWTSGDRFVRCLTPDA